MSKFFTSENNIKNVHLIGIGGISMSSIAFVLKHSGYKVTGSDRNESKLIDSLRKEGIDVKIGQCAENIGDCNLVIYTSAVSDDNPELKEARRKNIPCIVRAQALGELMLGYKKRIGISGTHGKSTTTAMIGCIFNIAERKPTILNGAVMSDISSAYLIGSNDFFIFEACEYTDSFLSFYPTTAVVTNVEFDHADYFHSTEQYIDSFARYMNIADTAVVNIDSENSLAAIKKASVPCITCSCFDNTADYFASNIVYEGGFARFDISFRGEKLCRVALSVPGEHNIYDALTAAAAAHIHGISAKDITDGLKAFYGTKRRFEYKGDICDGAKLFDDYAHHPSEITATLSAAKKLGGRVICVYQPHSISRTAELFDDFVQSFGDSDELILTDIYENLEHDTGAAGVTSLDLSKKIPGSLYIKSFGEISDYIKDIARPGDNIIIMGAGNVGKICDMLLED